MFFGKMVSAKRGISNIFVSVLIILMAIVAVFISWRFVLPSFNPSADMSRSVELNSASFSIVSNSFVASENNISFVIKREPRGYNGGIGLVIILEDSEGKTIRIDKYSNISLGKLETAAVFLSAAEYNFKKIVKISFYSAVYNVEGKLTLSSSKVMEKKIVNGEDSSRNSSLEYKAPQQDPGYIPISEALDMKNHILVLYNENSLDAREIAEYYANARNIPPNRLCGVKLPPGQYASANELLGARKTIIENCLCNIVNVPGCGLNKVNEIAMVSPITHMAIIKGIPPRLTGTIWDEDSEEPVFDYYLSLVLYQEPFYFEQSYPKTYEQDTYGGDTTYVYFGDDVDHQTNYSFMGFVREINTSLDKIVAFGRIEAMNKERTKSLIDRTLQAEREGFYGNFLVEQAPPTGYILSEEHLVANISQSSMLQLTPWLFFQLGSGSNTNCDYISSNGIWNPNSCRLGVNLNGDVPGEPGGNVNYSIDAGIFIGNWAQNNSHNAFDGFTNMIKWRKASATCIPLCKDAPDPVSCRANSKDYFKEINTDCVGVANGFIGWQSRSWPVQYYGFWPPGWIHLSGGNGAYEKTPPRVLQGDSFKNSKFTDNYYLHYGADDAKANPECVLANGTVISCEERVCVNLRQGFHYSAPFYTESGKNYTLRFRHRNNGDSGAVLDMVFSMYYNDSSQSTKYTFVSMAQDTDGWKTDEINVSTLGGKYLIDLDIDFSTPMENVSRRNLDLDGFEFLNGSGYDIFNRDAATFNITYHESTTAGDYPANAIDRLGGIAWWGSSSHFMSWGGSFSYPFQLIGAFFAGRTLGEGLAYNGNVGGGSGLIYGDPAYRPAGVKIYVNEGLNGVSNTDIDRESYFGGAYISSGFKFGRNKINNTNVYINAFNGQDKYAQTRWKLFVCYKDQVVSCSFSDWKEVTGGDSAVWRYKVFDDISFLTAPLDLNSDQKFFLRLDMWVEGEEDNVLSAYGKFVYDKNMQN